MTTKAMSHFPDAAEWRRLLEHTARRATDFLAELPDRPVGVPIAIDRLQSAFPETLPDEPQDPHQVVDELVDGLDAGLVASAGPRYFGYVVGGALPAALAADWLTSAWDQQAGVYDGSPAAAAIEAVVSEWIVKLLGLPAGTTVGFPTGAAQANLVALAAARWRQLHEVGWDIEEDGLFGAPALEVFVSADRHVTVDAALGHLGIGRSHVTEVATDEHGRMRPGALRAALDGRAGGPAIVCAQAGNVNTGASDPLREVGTLAREAGAWLHVDGAFGIWARVAPEQAQQVDGLELARSWATDAHKWLNVPYDSGIVLVADPDAHAASMHKAAVYSGSDQHRFDGASWVPEFSRRARGLTIYAALRSLGRSGLAALVARDCALARRFAAGAGQIRGVDLLNDVALNQVLLGFEASGAPDDTRTSAIIEAIQRDGVFWAGRSRWRGRAAMRVSISGWATFEDDVDRAVASLARAVAHVGARTGEASRG